MPRKVSSLTAIVVLLALLSGACENDIERINLLTSDNEAPVISGINVNVMYSDSGKVKIQILAPVYQQFPNQEKPYMEFPEGIEPVFQDLVGLGRPARRDLQPAEPETTGYAEGSLAAGHGI